MLKTLIIIAIIMIIISIAYYLISNHITLDFKSLFKKGFKKIDNDFRVILLYSVNSGKRKNFYMYKVSHSI